ncbi:hypothetical protein BDQ12DRAFT_299490 [Crucibulum laeve]|uniref:Uncharacterized protein n=1 Tax=Crucibulum laeve TaxID=68775 RepID=A0A5C3MCN0_9AGAR|nr:hypothetical protein BDQ12DRAFT_299490 [Crucibulum laeve]
MDEWEDATGRPPVARWIRDLWTAWVVIIPLAYIAGFVLLPRQFHQEKQGISTGQESYIALSDGSSSPRSRLLFDTPEDDAEEYKEYRPSRSMETVRMVSEFETGVPGH